MSAGGPKPKRRFACPECGQLVSVRGHRCKCYQGETTSNANRKIETAIDIALNAGHMIAGGMIWIKDSRELVRSITELAELFEASGYDPDDYVGAVDAFSARELLARYRA